MKPRFCLLLELVNEEEAESGDTDRRGYTDSTLHLFREPEFMTLRDALEEIGTIEPRQHSGDHRIYYGHSVTDYNAPAASYRRGIELARHARAIIDEVNARGLPAALEAADSTGIKARMRYARALVRLATDARNAPPVVYGVSVYRDHASIEAQTLWLVTDWKKSAPELRRIAWRSVQTTHATAAAFALRHAAPVTYRP